MAELTEAQKARNEAVKVANAKIAEHVAAAEAALAEAEKIANEVGVSFYFSPAYGMGGHYEPNDGWISSSQDC